MSNENEKMITVSEKALAALIATAVATVIAQATPDQPKAETIATVGARHEAKRVKNARKRQSSAKKTSAAAPAPVKPVTKHYDASKPVNAKGFVDGLLAKSGTSYLLIDKVANRKTQCNVVGCRIMRKGRSRFCAAHHKENGRNMFAKNGETLNETKR